MPFHGGLKSRAESGAKAPHSMECGDLSPIFGKGFNLHNLPVGPERNRNNLSGWNPTLQSAQWSAAFHGGRRPGWHRALQQTWIPPQPRHW